MIYNSFGDSLKRLERKLKIIGSTIENVRAFFDCGNTYQMYEHALKLEEQMAQAFLHTPENRLHRLRSATLNGLIFLWKSGLRKKAGFH